MKKLKLERGVVGEYYDCINECWIMIKLLSDADDDFRGACNVEVIYHNGKFPQKNFATSLYESNFIPRYKDVYQKPKKKFVVGDWIACDSDAVSAKYTNITEKNVERWNSEDYLNYKPRLIKGNEIDAAEKYLEALKSIKVGLKFDYFNKTHLITSVPEIDNVDEIDSYGLKTAKFSNGDWNWMLNIANQLTN